jgi:uncharacterized protein (TIGR03435 family)
VYALVVAKGGVKMKPSEVQDDIPAHYGFSGKNDEVSDRKATMPHVDSAISNGLDRPLIDHTGLTGTYDLHLIYSSPRLVREDDPAYINIFTAVQEQLGLKLEARKEPIEALVVDAAHRPTEN